MKRSFPRKTKSKVFLVEPDPTVRLSLARLINEEADLTVCGVADGIDEAIARLPEALPDVVVVNVDPLNGIVVPALNRLRWAIPQVPLVAVSLWEEKLRGRRMMQAGVSGYVPKSKAAIRIIPALRRVLKGGVYPGRWAGRKRPVEGSNDKEQ